ncbi:MAG TPA: ABC transporter ATP-binding protein [Candidatus Latescibacteria bacterium]|nr:ABC transporter ATP-binding protein [Candidatus Latescibacterota bacterium]
MPGFEGRGGGHHYGMGPVSGPVLPGGDIGNGVAGLPESVRAAFLKSAGDGEEILVAATSDLSPDGRYGEQHVLASKNRLCLAVPNGDQPNLSMWPLKELKKASVDLLVGQASLVATIGKDRVELCRFTNSKQREFHRLAALLEELARNGAMPEEKVDPKDSLPRYCSRCSRLLPEPGGTCPACLKRGQVLVRLLGYLRPHWKRAALLIAAMIVSALIETLPPYLTKVLIDDVINRPHVTTIAGWNASHLGWSRVAWLALIVTLFLFSRILLVGVGILGGRQATWLGPRIVADLRGKLYNHLQRLSLNYFDKSRTGALISRVTHDTAHVQGFLVNGVPHVGIDLFLLVFIGMILFSMNWQLTLAILVPLPIVIYVSKNFWRFMRSLFGRAWARSARLVATLNDSLNGIRVVKAFGQEEQEIARFNSRNWDLVSAETRAEMTWATFFPAITFLTMLGQFIIWYVGGSNVIDGTMSLGTLLAFFSYLGMFYRPIQMIARMNEWLTRDLTAAERVFEILDTAPDVKDSPNPIQLNEIRGEIRLENVRFGYDPLRPVLKGISIDIQPGEMIGLVGRSGAGKTTIINMICRFYDPQEGVVRVDGIDLRDVRQEDWHRFIGIVPQEPFLFHGTVKENIAYAKPDATVHEIIRAARAANAHQFIVRFPDGYDTQVGERGTRLSGGERQRISIARAILHDPRILILDEATSNVDTETEQQIQDAIARLVKGRTVFAIAHRLSTLKNANRLLVIEDGQVVEFGTHDELLLKEGVYAKLVNAQRQLSSITAVGG